MFQRKMTPLEDLAKIDKVCQEMSNGVDKCLEAYESVVERVVKRMGFVDPTKPAHTPIVTLMFSFAEAIDGVSALVRVGSVQNCGQLLRTALELSLQLQFIVEDDANFARRAAAYEYFHWKNLHDLACRLDKTHPRGIEITRELIGQNMPELMDVRPEPDVTAQREHYAKVLKDAQFADVHTEYTSATKPPKYWYSLWGGPKNFRELAKYLKQLPFYELLYRSWSGSVHGTNGLNRVAILEQGFVNMRPIRSPIGCGEVCQHASNATNLLCFLLSQKFIPEYTPELRQVYIERVRPFIQVFQNEPFVST